MGKIAPQRSIGVLANETSIFEVEQQAEDERDKDAEHVFPADFVVHAAEHFSPEIAQSSCGEQDEKVGAGGPIVKKETDANDCQAKAVTAQQ